MRRWVNAILIFLGLAGPWTDYALASTATRLPSTRQGATASGATFSIPASWSMEQRLWLIVLRPPEPDLHVAVVEVGGASDAIIAARAAWGLYRTDGEHSVTLATSQAPHNGWDEQLRLEYEHLPSEHRELFAIAYRRGARWTVVIQDGSEATAEKRQGAVNLILESLRPAGYQPESFAGRQPHRLDAGRVAALNTFLQNSMKELGVPGSAMALIDHGEVVFEGGIGVRELGRAQRVDNHTLFMIGSNTKALTTLLLGKLVDEGSLGWEEAVTRAYPEFRLGNATTTRRVKIRHLVCACTGLPRKDFEWVLNTPRDTPAASTFSQLAVTMPTSGFGEVFQYNNLMAAAAGYIGGHIVHPDRELGAAYDDAMSEMIFGPLEMRETTFDMGRALTGNYASPHGDDIDGRPNPTSIAMNRAIEPYRPAGGAWSSVHDLIKYVHLELNDGVLPNGLRFVSANNLLMRRAPNVPVGESRDYGMGLAIDRSWGVTVIHHGGSLAGFQSDFLIIPGASVGAVILTNADDGEYLLRPFMRRLLEILYDGKSEATEDVAAAAGRNQSEIKEARKSLAFPPEAVLSARLSDRYVNPALGQIVVRRGSQVTFDFGTWSSRVASRRNDDGTVSFITLEPSYDAFEFVVSEHEGKRALITSDGQHQYLYDEAGSRH
jgi:CubicO group peptidase (beta-lactamase class C family)